MLPISVSIPLGLIFLLVGAINLWLVLEACSHSKAARFSARMLALHRIGGYVFIALFCVMGWFMAGRLRNGGVASPNPPAPDKAGAGFTLSFAASGKTVPVLEGETLLETATAAGVAIPSACRQGQAEVFVNDDDLCAASFSHVSATRPAM